MDTYEIGAHARSVGLASIRMRARPEGRHNSATVLEYTLGTTSGQRHTVVVDQHGRTAMADGRPVPAELDAMVEAGINTVTFGAL